jgi:hypothetical protein
LPDLQVLESECHSSLQEPLSALLSIVFRPASRSKATISCARDMTVGAVKVKEVFSFLITESLNVNCKKLREMTSTGLISLRNRSPLLPLALLNRLSEFLLYVISSVLVWNYGY